MIKVSCELCKYSKVKKNKYPCKKCDGGYAYESIEVESN
jgi:hypothetical protein